MSEFERLAYTYEVWNEHGSKPCLMASFTGFAHAAYDYAEAHKLVCRNMAGERVYAAANGHGFTLMEKLRKHT